MGGDDADQSGNHEEHTGSDGEQSARRRVVLAIGCFALVTVSKLRAVATLNTLTVWRMLRYAWRLEANHWVAVGTIVMAALTYGLYVTSNRQWQLARAQLKQARLIYEGQQRPWVHTEAFGKQGEFSDPAPGASIIVQFKNSGLTPARKLRVQGATDYPKTGGPSTLHYGGLKNPPSVGILAPGQTTTMTIHGQLEAGETAESTVGFKAWVYGFIEYRDKFDRRYCTTFCSIGSPIIGATSFDVCSNYNEMYDLKVGDPCPPPTETGTPSATATP